MPVTAPVVLFTVAVAVPLLHAPPVVAVARVVVLPAHTFLEPVMPAGKGFIVIVLVTSHPAPSEYVIVTAPVTNPLTTPVAEPTDASTGLLLLHVPPVVMCVSDIAPPTHTPLAPLMAAGNEVTFTVVAVAQPVARLV